MEKYCRYIVWALIWSCSILAGRVAAQVAVPDTSIVQYLERKTTGGTIHIQQPLLLEQRLARENIESDRKNSATISVYRVQLFSDNRIKTAKEEAEAKSVLVRNTYPELEVLVTYTSPFWRVRVGNYHSYEEANTAMRQMKEKFPDMASEMRIVREKINVQVPDYVDYRP